MAGICPVGGPFLEGDGWLKTLPFWLPFLRRASLMHMSTRNARRAKPATDPITIPAIAPPERPVFPELFATGVAVLLAVAVGIDVFRETVGVMVGKTTFAHLDSMFEL